MTDSTVRYLPADNELRERFVAATFAPGAADWPAVRRRARALRPRPGSGRRWTAVAVAAAVAAFAGIAAPALGVGAAIVDFFSSEPAAPNVRVTFAEMNEIGGKNGPGAIASDARQIHVFQTPSGDYALSVTPTEAGSFCWSIAGLTGGCQTILSARGPFKDGEVNPIKIGLVYSDIPAPTMAQTPVLIGGNVLASSSARLTLEFEDGATEQIPFVWVTEPIGAGFFLYELPRERWAAGKRPVALALRSSEERMISRVTFSVTSTIDDFRAQPPPAGAN